MLKKKIYLAVSITGFACLMCFTPLPQRSNAIQGSTEDKNQIAQGREAYMRYCASCHGIDAKGRGPVTPALRKKPADLTRISLRYGKFEKAKIRSIITGDTRLPIHGEKEMPVWGGILQDSVLDNLVKYLESIQRPAEMVPVRYIVN
ncbi:MAG: cytochrome c [Acidobacteria bacterium]|nr:cytochrome c [Acidobacteriota bacterium]MCI0664655.1 cytochrome c [Acidobacteriota bacterium]